VEGVGPEGFIYSMYASSYVSMIAARLATLTLTLGCIGLAMTPLELFDSIVFDLSIGGKNERLLCHPARSQVPERYTHHRSPLQVPAICSEARRAGHFGRKCKQGVHLVSFI